MTKELAREVSGFCLSSPCEVWWIAVLNMSRSRADGTISSWLLYFRNFTNFHTVSFIIWTPLWTKCASAAAILSNISADAKFSTWLCLEYAGNFAPCCGSHLLKCTNFPAVETVNMLSGKVASFAKGNLQCQHFQFWTKMSLDVKINNFVRDISLICSLPSKSWHDVVFIFLRLRREDSKQTTQSY